MVNINREILKAIKTSEAVSGEQIAEKLGISRVAVWKRIKGLREQGYKIASSRSGYRLMQETAIPLPEQFSEAFPYHVSYRHESSSTMDQARREKSTDDALYIAGSQSSGRGRRGRTWISPRGGIYASLALHPGAPYSQAMYPVMLLSSCAAELIQELSGKECRIAWPNDLMLEGGGKIAGVLTELHGKFDRIERQIIGLGINRTAPKDLPRAAALPVEIPPALFLDKLFTRFHQAYLQQRPSETAAKWRSLCALTGKRVHIELDGSAPQEGLVVNLADDGTLLLKRDDESIIPIREGDCRRLYY